MCQHSCFRRKGNSFVWRVSHMLSSSCSQWGVPVRGLASESCELVSREPFPPYRTRVSLLHCLRRVRSRNSLGSLLQSVIHSEPRQLLFSSWPTMWSVHHIDKTRVTSSLSVMRLAKKVDTQTHTHTHTLSLTHTSIHIIHTHRQLRVSSRSMCGCGTWVCLEVMQHSWLWVQPVTSKPPQKTLLRGCRHCKCKTEVV